MTTKQRKPVPEPERQYDITPPHDLDAEAGVLGSLMLDPRHADDVAIAVRPEDFFSPNNRLIFEHMLALHNAGKTIDDKLLFASMKKTGDFEVVGGTETFLKLAESLPVASNAEWYAKIVAEKATLRRLLFAAIDAQRDVLAGAQDAREIMSEIERRMFSVFERASAGEIARIDDVLHHAMLAINERINHGGGVRGLSTGYADLDDKTGGMCESELTILAARPGMGKSALAVNIASHVSVECSHPVMLVTLEMSRLELAERMLSSLGQVDSNHIRNGHLNATERQRLIQAHGTLAESPILIDDTASRTMTEIASAARRQKRRGGLKLLVIDYLQLIEPDNPKDPREQQVSKIARRLKGLARELKIPVLCLSQLNRQADERGQPRLSHLRESGSIEQDADGVWFVHREDYFDTHSDKKGEAKIIVAKNRHGPTGDVNVVWQSQWTRFVSRAKQEDKYDFS